MWVNQAQFQMILLLLSRRNMEQNNLRILARNELGFISKPKGLDMVHLCFNNLMINFTQSDFETFRGIVKRIHLENGSIVFPDGRERILLHSPYDGINFSFDLYELHQLVSALDEAYYMQQIYSYMNEG